MREDSAHLCVLTRRPPRVYIQAMRVVWAVCGFICVGLGAIGIVLPLLPTVPFMLLAAFCFARSSEALHRWLIEHPTFGPPIEDWNERGAISRRAKVLASIAILAAFGLALGFGAPTTALAIQAIVLGCVATFIWTRPD